MKTTSMQLSDDVLNHPKFQEYFGRGKFGKQVNIVLKQYLDAVDKTESVINE